MPLPIVHYALSRSEPGVFHEIRRHPEGQFLCTCTRFQFSKKPKHCFHTEWAWDEERKAQQMSQQQQRRGGQGGPPRANKYDLGDYVEVADRVEQFYKDYPDGRLWTEFLGIEKVGDKAFAVVKAYAARTADDPRPTTGLAWEPVPGLTPYTKNSELQNGETSAIGRAIVFINERYSTKGIASANEVRNRRGEQDPEPPAGGLRERLGEPPKGPRPPVDEKTGELLDDDQEAAYERYVAAVAQLLADRGHKANKTKLAGMKGLRARFENDEPAAKAMSWLVDLAAGAGS